MKVTRQDLLAPANFVTLAGLILTVAGCFQLQTPVGFAGAVFGRLLDILDGPIARRTHTSRFGAVLDATIDKLSILALVTGLLAFDLAPTVIVAYILLQNGLVAAVNLIAAHRHIIIQTVLSGKRNIFLQISSMLLFVSATFVNGHIRTGALILAYTAFAISLYYAALATAAYFRKHQTSNIKRQTSDV